MEDLGVDGRMILKCKKVIVKFSRYRHGVAQRVGRGTVLIFHDRGTRRGRVVSSTPRPHFTPGKDPVPISRPHKDSIPDRPARSQSLYRLSYPAHNIKVYLSKTNHVRVE